MKNVLLASTAIVAFSATAAAADISLSGAAEIGLTMNNDAAYDEVTVHTDVDLVWTLTGTTDNGLTFGANIDWDEAPTEESAAVFVSGAFGTFTAGDTDGALDARLTEIADGGLAGEADLASGNDEWDGAADGEGQVLRYDIAFGPATISASFENGRATNLLELENATGIELTAATTETAAAAVEVSETVGIGASATFGMVTVGAGFMSNDTLGEQAGASVQGTFGAVTGTVSYTEINYDAALGVDDDEIFGVSLVAALGAAEVGIQFEDQDSAAEDAIGVFVNYSLGGGATFTAAAGENHDGENLFGFGVGMSF